VILTGVADLLLLIWLFGREGLRYRDLLRFNRPTWKSDLLVLLGFSLLAGPIGYLPSVLGSQWIFGDAMGGPNLMFLPLPMWAAVASLIFLPVAIAISELPNYFALCHAAPAGALQAQLARAGPGSHFPGSPALRHAVDLRWSFLVVAL
jgi:hypothetical protein